MSSEEHILVEGGPAQKRLSVRLTQYEGTPLLELRFWFLSRKSGEYVRTKKGIMLSRNNYLLARESFATRHEEIMDWLGVGYVPEHVQKYEDAQASSLEEAKRTGAHIAVAHEPQAERFFRVSHEGAVDSVSLSESHPMGSQLAHLGANGCSRQDLDQLLGSLLSAYSRAKASLDGTPTTDASILFDQLEHNWSEILATTLSRRG